MLNNLELSSGIHKLQRYVLNHRICLPNVYVPVFHLLCSKCEHSSLVITEVESFKNDHWCLTKKSWVLKFSKPLPISSTVSLTFKITVVKVYLSV